MELKLTTQRALEYEERTGNDIVEKMQEIANKGTVAIGDVVNLFMAMGDNYTVEVFDAWEGTFVDKSIAVMNAVKDYIGEKKSASKQKK